MLTLVSYDIADDGDRAKAHRILHGYGQRVQYSVFECFLEPVDLEKLKDRLAPLVTGEFDSVRFYRLCAECAAKVEVEGWGDPPKEPDVWVV